MSSKDTPTSVSVTIGASASDNYVQTQTEAGSRAHIAGAKCPMYGKTTGVSKVQSPKVHMKHLSALVAIKLVNETGNPVTIEHLALVADTNPIVGTFTVDFTESTPSVIGQEGSSEKTANLLLKQNENTPGITIPKDGNQKFYMAVAPTTDKFTVYVNGTAITKDVSIELAAGKVTTIKVTIPAIQGTLTSNTTKDGTNFVTWDANTIANTKTGSINGITGINIYSVNGGLITIKGTLKEFLGETTEDCALPISFYAASKVKVSEGALATEQARIDITSVGVYKHIELKVFGMELLNEEIDMSFSGEDLSAKLGDIPTGFGLGKVGLFKDANSNIISIDESLNNYYLSEAKANGLLGRAVEGFVIQDLRDAIFDNSEEAWIKIVNLAKELAPGQFSEADGGSANKTSPLGSLLLLMVRRDVGWAARPIATSQLKTAELTVTLKTTGDVALWGMNVQSEDVDIN